MGLARSAIAAAKTQIRTKRGKVHEAGECDGPEVHGVDYVAKIKLEKLALDTWVNERGTKKRTDQKASG